MIKRVRSLQDCVRLLHDGGPVRAALRHHLRLLHDHHPEAQEEAEREKDAGHALHHEEGLRAEGNILLYSN